MKDKKMEILAPVNAGTLDAALAAGADAVYFGLSKLNARRGAKNFEPEQLEEVVTRIHKAGAKAHLTLNIDLSQRELGLAYRTLELARKCKVDAVIVRDFALIPLISGFPELEFHMSTQGGICNAAGVEFCKKAGFKRAVLAREMSLKEIQACSNVKGIELEVFVQGAMCFSCSGHCLLSSWVGGRSGNRGMCASPCRVKWHLDKDDEASSPFSMHDLCLAGHLKELAAAGVTSLKIEGRLKSAKWVSSAVGIYRMAMENDTGDDVIDTRSAELGNYTGRQVGHAYFYGERQNLTGDSGRLAGRMEGQPDCGCGSGFSENDTIGDEPAEQTFDGIFIRTEVDMAGGIAMEMSWRQAKDFLRIPPQRIANPKRSLHFGEILDEALKQIPGNIDVRCQRDDVADSILLPRRFLNTVGGTLGDFLRCAQKEKDGVVRLALAPELEERLKHQQETVSGVNRLWLGSKATRLRISLNQIAWRMGADVPKEALLPTTVEVIPGEAESQIKALEALKDGLDEIAFPPVLYQEELKWAEILLEFARGKKISVEVNSWDLVELARTHQVEFSAGAGLQVLNSAAADYLANLGAKRVTPSVEADYGQLEDLSRCCRVPLAMIVFSYPVLMQTRAEIKTGHYSDTRNYAIRAELAGTQITRLVPDMPFDWRTIVNKKIVCSEVVWDMVESRNPQNDIIVHKDGLFLFNYDRRLR